MTHDERIEAMARAICCTIPARILTDWTDWVDAAKAALAAAGVEEMVRERDRLRAAIEQAPHKLSCEWWSNKVTQEFSAAPDAMHRNCTCWKRAALEGKP